MKDETLTAHLVRDIGHTFRCFGGGRDSNYNPITKALKDYPLTFAAGVDVKEVVNFILSRIPA